MTEREELARLQKDAGIPDLPTQLTYECRMAMSGKGPRAYDWEDKPHRLIYDLCREIEWLSRPSPVDAVVAAAAAVVARWAMPQWKDAPPTADAMHRLNDALAAYDKATEETQ